MRTMTPRSLTILGAGASGVLALSAVNPAALGQGGPPAARVVVDAVRFEPVEQWREVTGDLRALRRALLASEEEGLVVGLEYQDGDEVKAGAVIARLHDVRARLDVEGDEAEVAARKALVLEREADAERFERDLTRMEEMRSRGAGNEKEYDVTQTVVRTAQARLAAAKAALAVGEADLRLSRQRLEDMTIEAPFDGVIVSKRTEVGQWLERGGSVAEVVDLGSIEVRLDVPERYIGRIGGPGQHVQVRVAGAPEIIACTVTAIVPDADALSRLFPVRVSVENKERRLRPGMSVVGLIPTGATEPTFTVHQDAILRNEAGEYVFFNGGGTAQVAPIQRMFAVGDRVAIRPGRLAPGDLVVVEGNERMFPGQALNVVGTKVGSPPAKPPEPPPGSSGRESGDRTGAGSSGGGGGR